jgi:hypothetical protein
MQELEGNKIETYIDFKKFHGWILGLSQKIREKRELIIGVR